MTTSTTDIHTTAKTAAESWIPEDDGLLMAANQSNATTVEGAPGTPLRQVQSLRRCCSHLEEPSRTCTFRRCRLPS